MALMLEGKEVESAWLMDSDWERETEGELKLWDLKLLRWLIEWAFGLLKLLFGAVCAACGACAALKRLI